MAGPIFCIILVVDCLFFQFLEWFIPRDQLDFVEDERSDGDTVFDRLVVRFARWRHLLTEFTGCGGDLILSALRRPTPIIISREPKRVE